MSGTQTLRDLVAAVERVLIGKHSEAELAIIGLAAAGHLLIEDVPGVGKTMLAKSLARATGCTFKRIQFTPDLLPSDVTGVSIYNQRTGAFEFRAGPIVAHVDGHVQRYIVHVVGLTRDHPDVYLGASPRGSLALMRAAQARAMLSGRYYVIPDDIKALATSALAHRLIMSPEARMRNATASAVIASVIQELPVPGSRVPA